MKFSIFLASLFGSFHCVGMCGGFVSMYSVGANKPLGLHLAYHSGRLFTYVTLGILAGLFGATITAAAERAGIPYAVSALLGGLLILSGLASLFPSWFRSSKARARKGSSFLLRPLVGLFRANSSTLSPVSRSFSLGALSTLLPCGWLYSFLVIAAASGGLFPALSVMLLFWLGTVPALWITGTVSQSAGTALARFAPKTTAILIVFIGLVTILRHDAVLLSPSNANATHGSSCHQQQGIGP